MYSANRRLLVAACLVVSMAGLGCNLIRARPEGRDAPAPRPSSGLDEKPTAEAMANYLNLQAGRLHSIECNDLEISAWSQGSSVGLDSGSLLCQKQKYFKLVGKKFGSQEVLVGSNDERFWFYVKRDPSDAMFHCAHADFERGDVELPFPFEPEWVLEALGMGTVPTGGNLRLEEDNQFYRLVEDTTVRGQKVRKVTECYKTEASGDTPQVKRRAVYDAQNRLICEATVKSVRRIPVGGKSVAVPKSIRLEWPAQDTKLVLDLHGVRINERLSMESFQMPRLGGKQVDLGRDRPSGRTRKSELGMRK